MRKAIKAAFFGLISIAFVGSATADITFVSWGGAYTASQQKAYIDTYSKGSSITVENYNGGLGEIKAQVEAGNVTWDVVDVLPDQAITGCDEGLFVKVDQSEFINDMVVPPVSDCVVPQIFWAYTAFYDKAAFPGKKPKNIKDFFDVKKFPGKRGIHTWANALIEMALVADGVKASKVYEVMSTPEGIDRAFAKLDTIKDDIVFWSAGSQPLELVKSGEVVMAIAYNGRVGAANLAEGENFEYIWEGQVLDQEYLCLLNGAPNRDAAIDFMMHASTPEAQAEQAKYITYGPMRASGIPIIQNNEPWGPGGVDIMPHMPNTPERLKVSIVSDPQWWSDNGAEINERYAAWMGN